MKVLQLNLKSKLFPTKMPSATQTKVTNDSPKEFTYTPPSQYSVDEHMETANWSWKHPSIPDSFFLKLQPPKNLEDAHTWMCCHQHNLEDYTVQMELNELEMAMLCDNGEPLPYNEDKMHELEEKKFKLLQGKRFHQNAKHCYWYWMQKTEG